MKVLLAWFAAAVVMLAPGTVRAAPDAALWNAVLAAHVRDGRVDYAALRRDRTSLDRYVAQIASVDAAGLAAMQPDEQLAYWINAYNAFVLRSVVDHYPIRGRTFRGLARPANSIWQIPDAFDGQRFEAGGRRVSLDDVEHAIMRPTFRDPRVHVALVCAARSCPPLRPEAYVAARLDAQLEDQARQFLADATRGLQVDTARGVVRVSKIFEWFGQDFAALGGGNPRRGVLEYVARHVADPALADRLRSGALRLEFLDYDWTLNDR